MPFYRSNLAPILLVSMLALSACDMPSTDTSKLSATLTAGSEVPPIDSKASGEADVKIDVKDYKLSWTIKYADLSGIVTGAHFHGPALAGVNADVAVPLNGDLASPIKGEATITAEQAAQLLEGKWYINLHTAMHPDGEIRGQVMNKK